MSYACAYPIPQLAISAPSSSPVESALSINWWPFPLMTGNSTSSISTSTLHLTVVPSPSLLLIIPTSSGSFTSTSLTHSPPSTTSSTSTTTPSHMVLSTSVTVTPTAEPTSQTSPFLFKVVYVVPAAVIIGISLLASVIAVFCQKWRRYRRRNARSAGSKYHRHPFPEDGGKVPTCDQRDDDEKQWVARRSHSEDNYWTDDSSEGDSTSSYTTAQRRTMTDASVDTRRYPNDPTRPSTFNGVPVSESFYNQESLEAGIDHPVQFDLSSDEEPPAPYAELRGGSIRRNLIRKIGKERKEAIERHDTVMGTVRSRGELLSIQSQRPQALFQSHPVFSPSYTHTLSPPLMRDLFYIEGPDASKEGWVTADKLLADQEQDSDEEITIHNAILTEGGRQNVQNSFPSSRSDDEMRGKEIPVSISALSITPAGRRLIRPSKVVNSAQGTLPGAALRNPYQERESLADPKQSQRDVTCIPHSSLQSVTLEKINEILENGWSRRELPMQALSSTSFGATLTSRAEYAFDGRANQKGDQMVFHGDMYYRTIDQGLHSGN
jgi:hypothetical protein